MKVSSVLAPPEGGDILSDYKPLVFSYLCWQVLNWTLALLQIGRAVGGAAWGFVETSLPADISFCLMMFLGTLHRGELPDGRLIFVCRLAFVIDGIAVLANQFTIFRPNSLQDALAFANYTLDPIAVPTTPGWSDFWRYFTGAMWCVVEGFVAPTIGVSCLAGIRRRMADGVTSAERMAFCNNFMRVYCAMLALQAGICAWAVLNVATATGLDAEVLALKTNDALTSLSAALAQSYAMKCALFDGAGRTFSDFLVGRGTRASYAAAAFWIVWIAGIIVTLLLCATASSSDEPHLLAADLWNQGPLLGATPNFFIWMIAGYNMGLTPQHLLSVERGEAKLAKKRAVRAEGEVKASHLFTPHAEVKV